MKKLLLFPIVLLFTFLGFSQTNLVPNGDLENWTAGNLDEWVSQEGDVSEETVEVTSGNKSALFIETRNTVEPTIVSNFLFEAGKTYNLHIDFKVKAGITPFGQQVIGVKYGPTSSFPMVSSNLIPQGFDWETRDYEIVVTTTEEWKLEVSAFTFADELFEVYIDNIKVFDPNETNPDRDALIALYNATDGPNWTNTWDLNADMSTWYGITLDTNNRVTEIDLRSNNLVGTLPSEIGNLTELTVFEINRSFFIGQIPNSISGNIPKEFGNLTKLKKLDLSFMDFSGSIPNEIGQMSSLEYLDLRMVNLSGSIPPELGQLSNLKFLVLGFQLNGQIPSELGQLSNLEELEISNSELTGSIPPELGQLNKLKIMKLGNNLLTGNIPIELGQLQSIESLGLQSNNLSGTIPKELGNLSTLKELSVRNNNLTGSIPIEITQLSNLTVLDLSNNSLNGILPNQIGLLINLTHLSLSSNDFSGTLPQEISQISNLEALRLAHNNFSGDLTNLPNTLNLIWIFGNSFIFENIEALILNFPNTELVYDKQSEIGEATEITLQEEEEFSLSITETVSLNNTYQWRKNEVNINGATNSSFSISNVQVSDAGSYDCLINNTIATELTIEKKAITLIINQVSDDADNDGINDSEDQCPNTPNGESVDANGCAQSQLDDDNDGVNNNSDNCPNTPSGNTVDAQGCIVNNSTLVNYLQNYSFEDWSGNPETPNSWVITNANSIVRNDMATDGNYSLELDLNNSLANKTEVQNESAVQLATNTTYTYAFDYKVNRGSNISVEVQISKDGNPFGIPIAEEFTSFNDDGNWHTFSFDFDTNTVDEEHFFTIFFRANTSITGIVQIDNLRVLGDALPDADNDGILDGNDLCPNTPPTALAVDNNGCEIIVDGNNLIEDPSFEDWSFGGGANLAKWGINLIPGSSWAKNEDISDNLLYSVELTTGNNGTNTSTIFQNDIQIYKGVAYIISIDYKVFEGTFNTLELELIDQVSAFGETVEKFTVSPSDSGWNTFSTIYTPVKSEVVDLNIRAISDLPQERILLDNLIIKVYSENTDSDNDGINDSEDQCPNTPSGETVDANGCSESQLDDDNDGVTNNNDICPDTPSGVTVDAQGCASNQSSEPNIPNNGIQVKATGTTCLGSENGEISVSFNADYPYTYTIRITANLLDNTFDNIDSSTGLVRSDLAAGTYTVCISIPEYPNFERCSTIKVETPEDFTSGKIVVDNDKRTGKMTVSGSKNYVLLVNDKEFNYSFDSTANRELSFELEDGVNSVVAKTDKACQGKYEESVLLNIVRTYPNPVVDNTTIVGIQNVDEADIIISDMKGVIVKRVRKTIDNSVISLSVEELPTGIYLVRIISDKQDVQTKIVKK